MARLRNTSRWPQEVETEAGRVSVPTGVVLDQAMSDDQVAAALKSGFFADADQPQSTEVAALEEPKAKARPSKS